MKKENLIILAVIIFTTAILSCEVLCVQSHISLGVCFLSSLVLLAILFFCMAWFGLLTPQNQLENLVSPMNRRKELIAILIGVILFFVSVVPTLRGGFDFKNDYINIAFAATSSIVITLLIIMLYHLSDLRQDFESKREIPKDKEMSELIELFIGSYINIRNSGDDFFKNRLNDVRNEFKIAISDLKNGHIVFEDSKRWECFILNMTRLLEDEDTLKATSHVIIPEWWDSEFGKRYIEENKKAIHNKKVKITRLFFVDENKVGDHAEKIKEHRDAAVEVRIIIMKDLNPAQIEDFMIAGENYVVYVDLYEGKIKRYMFIILKLRLTGQMDYSAT